jgi:hypothetical protein
MPIIMSLPFERPRKKEEDDSDGVIKEKNNESIPVSNMEINKYLFFLFCI